MILNQRVNIYALETLEKLCTLETAPNPKVQHLPAYHLCIAADSGCSLPASGECACWWLQQDGAV